MIGPVYQACRHVFKSGPAEVRECGECKSGGEHKRGYTPSRKGGLGDLPREFFLIYGCLYVLFLMHFGCVLAGISAVLG